MKTYKSGWRRGAGCLLLLGILSSSALAYTSSDNRVPSPTYHSTNTVTYMGGTFAIDSFFDVFVDIQRVSPPANGTTISPSFSPVSTQLGLLPPGGPHTTALADGLLIVRYLGLAPGSPYPYGDFSTEMLQMNLQGGSLPMGMMIRESPTLASTGHTQIGDVGAGLFQIDSFFDVFTELSLDGGQTWNPASGPLHIVGDLPEPSSAVLVLMGVATVGHLRRRRGNR